MSDRAIFGDFVNAAAKQLEATDSGTRRVTTSADVHYAVRALLRMVTVMSRCIAVTDTSANDMTWRYARDPGAWTRARAEARQALDNAAEFLRPHIRGRPGPGISVSSAPKSAAARRIAAAALSLQAGHDLLQTHYSRKPNGLREYRSPWAPAIGSDQVSSAMLTELGKLAHRAAAQASGVALAPSPSASWAARRDLNTACQWLWVFVGAVRSAQRDEPVPAATRHLLRHIPLNTIPPRRVPVGGEPVPDLCDGVISTAERLRRAARALTPHAAWSPAMTITSLTRTAGAATVTSHNCELLLTTLAECEPAAQIRQQLLECSAAAARARESWLAAAYALDNITTDTRGYLSPAAAETTGLALWTGRLAFANPEWRPSAGPRHPARPPASLISAPEDMRRVVDAVHYTCDTLTSLARASREQIRVAARASRILVPTRTLPGSIDIPHPFAPAPDEHIASLLSRYRDAAAASSQATKEVAVVAETIHAPSQVLTAFREAIQAATGATQRRAHQANPNADAPDRDPDLPGPLQSVLHQLGVTDRDLIAHACALDRDGARLVIDAAEKLSPTRGRATRQSLEAAPVVNHVLASFDSRSAAFLRPQSPHDDRQHEAQP